jgi:hypothetical protein
MYYSAPRAAALGALLLVLPCPATGQQAAAEASRDVITAQEIVAAQVNNAFDAVERLRPDFLRRSERPQTIYGRTRAGTAATSTAPENATERALSRDRSGLENDIDGPSGPLKIGVFVDGSPLGDARSLKRIPAGEVQQIRFLSATDAQQRYGSGYSAGVIEVTLRSN